MDGLEMGAAGIEKSKKRTRGCGRILKRTPQSSGLWCDRVNDGTS